MEREDEIGTPPMQQVPPVAPSPPPVVHALSGSVGAVVAMALLYPLDQVRAILQVNCMCHGCMHPMYEVHDTTWYSSSTVLRCC